MLEKINLFEKEIVATQPTSLQELESFSQKFLSRKSVIANLFPSIGKQSAEERKFLGEKLNHLKILAQEVYANHAAALQSESAEKNVAYNAPLEDYTALPKISIGSKHPITTVSDRVCDILCKMGFALIDGPEIEDDWHNFTALNIPADHPARDMQDTFYVKGGFALRSQTSSAQIRAMETQTPPIRIVSCGRVYRNEAISARAHCFFNQIEALYVDEGVSFVDLKTALLHFLKQLFGADIKLRLRPSYFPFTEPSVEVDISCTICRGCGCKICKNSGWLEIGGAGMVDPQVLINCKIDPEVYSGFAWGMGIERIAMLLYQIDDLRLFTENDTAFLRQFSCTM